MVRNQPEVTQHDEPVLGRFRGGGGPVPGSKREEAQDELLSFPTSTVLASTRKRGREQHLVCRDTQGEISEEQKR